MANKLYIDRLLRLTLVRKGATAKHPALRTGVVETVKAVETAEPAGTPALDRWRNGRWG